MTDPLSLLAIDVKAELASTATKDAFRTVVRAALQLNPWGGGAIAEMLGHFWPAASERKIIEMITAFADEIQRLGSHLSAVERRIATNESAQRLLADTVSAAVHSVSPDERKCIGLLLARGITSTDRKLTDAMFLLQRWRELDRIEMLMFLTVGNAARDSVKATLDYPDFGGDYFTGADHYEIMYKDDIHRQRLDHLLALAGC